MKQRTLKDAIEAFDESGLDLAAVILYYDNRIEEFIEEEIDWIPEDLLERVVKDAASTSFGRKIRLYTTLQGE